MDVVVAAAHQEFDILDDLEHRAALVERLRRNARTIAVMNTIVSPLKDRPETFLKLVDRSFSRRMLIAVAHRDIACRRDAEKPYS